MTILETVKQKLIDGHRIFPQSTVRELVQVIESQVAEIARLRDVILKFEHGEVEQ
jgi:hypothetical protein